MQHQPAKAEENETAGPEDPPVLLRPPFHHPNGIAADAQRCRHAVQSLLGPLKDFALVAQIAKHGAAPLEVLV